MGDNDSDGSNTLNEEQMNDILGDRRDNSGEEANGSNNSDDSERIRQARLTRLRQLREVNESPEEQHTTNVIN